MKTIIFDLDGTLAYSKEAIDEEMASLVTKVLKHNKVVIVSGASWAQIQKQVLQQITDSSVLNELYILPNSGSSMYQLWGKYGWVATYQNTISNRDAAKISKTIEESLKEIGFEQPKKLWGHQIEEREGQVTFSALGQNAPIDIKTNYDPDFFKRRKIVDALQRKLPSYEINVSGTTSVDICMPGIDKKYGIDELMKRLHISKDDVLYVGDFIFKGGSNYVAIEMGLEYQEVRGPEETKKWIRDFLDSSNGSNGIEKTG